jgi:hypothetical protein
MEIKDGDELVYVDCYHHCGVICITNDPSTASKRAAEHRDAHPSHTTYVEMLGFTQGNLPSKR